MSKKKNDEKIAEELENKDPISEEIIEEKSETEKLTDALAAQKDSYLRLAAEYENYRKRTASEKLTIYADATAKAIEEILPLIDSLHLAMDAAKDAPEEYKKGLSLMENQLNASFEKLKIESFGEAGEEFNPALHHAVSKIEDDSFGENTVSVVFQKGYKIGDKIIRYCMVQVAN
ncbi:MAG: nucleotide exchange factor GrpE [Bacillota bacterium]|nr:nucleotide exchange factor GrpE [Bacillota bacterium]